MSKDDVTTKKKQSDVTSEVMSAIATGKVKMRSRFYFVAISMLMGVGTAGAFLAALAFAVRVAVQFHVVRPHAFLSFGGPGLRPFMVNFPWVSVLVALVGIGGGLYLLRRYEFSYKRTLLPVAVAVVALIALVGGTIGFAAVQHDIHKSRSVGPFLERPAFRDRRGIVGIVYEVRDSSVVVRTPRGSSVEVVWSRTTRFPTGSEFAAGDVVHAVGERHNGTFTAHVIGLRDNLKKHKGTVKGRQRHERKSPLRLY